MRASSPLPAPVTGGRYVALGQLGSGGMGTVLYGQFNAPGGFSRPVAIKRMHLHLAEDPQFVSLFLDEARLAARIAHANVVATLDVLLEHGSLSVVMEYVHGESLAALWQLCRARGDKIPLRVAASLMVGVLHGLHAAHETCDAEGRFLGLVHRDVSHENILVGVDGVARLLDFGIAKAADQARSTPAGHVKGKLAYMAPEQYSDVPVDRRADVYGASVVLWELLVGRSLFTGDSQIELMRAAIRGQVSPPRELAPEVPLGLEALVMRGLSKDPAQRFETARAMARALEREAPTATQSEVCAWLDALVGERMALRATQLSDLARQYSQNPSSHVTTPLLQPMAMTRPAEAPGSLTGSQPSDSADSPEPGMARKPGARRPGLGIAAVLLLVCAGAAGFLWWSQRADAPGSLPPEPRAHTGGPASREHAGGSPPPGGERSPTREAQPLHATPPNPPYASPPEQANGREQAEAVPSFGRRALTDESRRAQSGRSHREPEPAASVPTRPRPSNCVPPYTVDPRGIRRFKPECL